MPERPLALIHEANLSDGVTTLTLGERRPPLPVPPAAPALLSRCRRFERGTARLDAGSC
ncbi:MULTISPECIES: hypothetical protein [Sorangium]|uniref:Uncharacterized protein n=1 Tax=Sorangium atrum TaxID=2995308 RepID=A0ABT5C7I7_9BACT|nr:hypothetical protein [Sorangium aterium]MDC0682397.1 hypothetical protein [Sorangium aterium]